MVQRPIPLSEVLRIPDRKQYKLHLACRNAEGTQPLDEYVADPANWLGWNQWRDGKDVWNRPRVLAFMEFYHRADTWLFDGVSGTSDLT